MKTSVVLPLLFLLAMTGRAQLPDRAVPFPFTDQLLPGGSAMPPSVQLPPARAGASLSAGVYTTLQGYYDYQTNGASNQYIRVDSVTGTIHVVYMTALDSLYTSPSRRTVYARSTDNGLTWSTFGGLTIPAERSGYPSMDFYRFGGVSRALVANHNAVASSENQSVVYLVDSVGGVQGAALLPLLGTTTEPIYPFVASSSGGVVVLRASGNDGMGTPHSYIIRSTNGGTSWGGWQTIPVDAGKALPVAADGAGRVATLAWSDSLYLSESADDGATWQAPILIHPKTRIAAGETLGLWVGEDLVYRGSEPFVALTVSRSVASGGLYFAGSRIQVWSPGGGLQTAVPWDAQLGPSLMAPQANHLSVGSPAIGVSGTTLVIAYTQFLQCESTIDMLSGGRNFGEIFMVKSTDGGITWSVPRNLTNTPQVDERYPSIGKWNPAGYANITWQEDARAGTHLFAEFAPLSLSRQVFLRLDLNAAVPSYFHTPCFLSYGSVPVGTPVVDSVLIRNRGDAALTVTSGVITGSPDFTLPGGLSLTLAPRESARVAVRFLPASSGPRSALLTITHSAEGSPVFIPLDGTGVAPPPAFGANPAVLDFGGVTTGTMKEDTVTLRNTGGGTLQVLSASVAGPAAFTVLSTFPVFLGEAESSLVLVRFEPNSAGPFGGHLVVAHDAAGSPDSITLAGTGVEPSPVFGAGPAVLNFGDVTAGEGAEDSVVMWNGDGGTVQVLSAAVTGFPVFTVLTAFPMSLSGAESAWVRVRFEPDAAGPVGADLIFAHDAVGSPDSVALAGNGLPSGPSPKFLTIPPETLIAKDAITGKLLKPVKRPKPGKPVLFPNWANLRDEVIAQGGFAPGTSESDSAGGLVIGISHMQRMNPGTPANPNWKPVKDSAAVQGWVRIGKYNSKKSVGASPTAIPKTLENKTFRHTGPARGLDSTGSPGDLKRKAFLKEQKKLDPKKTSNRLFAEILALKFSIAASQLEKIPAGLGELVFDRDGNPLDELTVAALAARVDTMMGRWRLYGQEDFDSAYAAVRDINRAFRGALDTVSFMSTLVLRGAVELDDVAFLRLPSSFRPVVRRPTSSATEPDEDFEDEETDEQGSVPLAARLYPNYPNPFNPVTTIAMRFGEPVVASLRVYNILGQEVAVLLENEEMEEGVETVEFNAGRFASGVYTFRLVVTGEDGRTSVATGKMLLLR